MRQKIIGLTGKARSGKDTSGKILAELAQGATLAFADRIKELCRELFSLSTEQLYGDKKEEPTDLPCLICPKCASVSIVLKDDLGFCDICNVIGSAAVFNKYWTPRMILQYVGTETMRKVDKGVWVKRALTTAHHLLASKDQEVKLVIVTDVRYRNECEAIWNAGGEVWRIVRPGAEAPVGLTDHPSEKEQESISDQELQAVILNDSTLDTLKGRLATQLNSFMERYKQ